MAYELQQVAQYSRNKKLQTIDLRGQTVTPNGKTQPMSPTFIFTLDMIISPHYVATVLQHSLFLKAVLVFFTLVGNISCRLHYTFIQMLRNVPYVKECIACHLAFSFIYM